MIWGKTHQERDLKNPFMYAQKWFAWRPVQLNSGRWVWLQKIYYKCWASWASDGTVYALTKEELV